MANSEKNIEPLDTSELASLANPIAKKYYLFFKCLGVPQDEYKENVVKLIVYAKEACTSKSSFSETIEEELINLLKNSIDKTSDRDKTLEKFLKRLESKHETVPTKAIKEFDMLVHSLYDKTDIVSHMMRKGSTLFKIMERICKTYTEQKEGKLIIKIGDPIVLEYIDLYNESNKIGTVQATREIRDFIMENLSVPSFTENQMLEIGKRVLHGDQEAQTDLVRSECKLVKQSVDKYKDCFSDYQKLLEVGYNALIESSRSFDYTKGIKFKTFATFNIEKRIFKAIIDEWEREKHYDKKWNEIRALELRLSRTNCPFTGKIIEEELGFENGNIVLKVYLLRKKYEETKDSDLMSNEYGNNGRVKETDDIPKLLIKLRDSIGASDEVFNLFADLKGLKDGLIKSSSSMASCLGIDVNKVRSYRLAVEGAINKNIESRKLFDVIMSKRQRIVESVKNRLQPIIDKAQKSVTISSSIDITDSDKELIALFESETSIMDIAIYFQIPKEKVEERLEKLKGNYSITEIVEKEKTSIVDAGKEDDDMGRLPKTLKEILGIGEIMTWEQFMEEFETFSDDLQEAYYNTYGDNLDQPTKRTSEQDRNRVNYNNSKLRNKYKGINGVTEETQKRVKGAYKPSVISITNSKPEDFFQIIPDNLFKIAFFSFSQSDQKKLENCYGIEKLKKEFPKEATMSLDNVSKYLKERFQKIETKKESSPVVAGMAKQSSTETKKDQESLPRPEPTAVKQPDAKITPNPVKEQVSGIGIVPPQQQPVAITPSVEPVKKQVSGTEIVLPQQPVAQPRMDSVAREKYNNLLNGVEFAKTIEALKESSLAKEIYLSRPVEEAIVIKLLLGIDEDFPLTSFEKISKVIRVDEEQIEGIVHSFFSDLNLRLNACEDMIIQRRGLQIKQPKD